MPLRSRYCLSAGVSAFTGTMTQVRLQPTVVQNVTTYSAIIDVPKHPTPTEREAYEALKRAAAP